MTSQCRCAAYREAEMGAPIAHTAGDIALSGNCMLTPCLLQPTEPWVIGGTVMSYNPGAPGPRIELPTFDSPGRIVPAPPDTRKQAALQWKREHMAKMHAARRLVNVHNDPSVVNRLIRLIEELLERDDVRMDADSNWYYKQLGIIKEQINGEEVDTGAEGTEDYSATGSTREE